MSQFRRFNSSDNTNYDSSYVGKDGELTWDPSNGLRIHDGSTSGGISPGGNFPTGAGAIHTIVFGGGNSNNNRKLLRQNDNIESEWAWADRLDTADDAINLNDQATATWGGRSGMVVVTDHYNGWTYAWLCGGGGVVKLGDTSDTNPDTCTMTFTGGQYTLTNTSGTNRNFGVAWIITRHNT